MRSFDFACMRQHLTGIRELVQEIHAWAAHADALDEPTRAALLHQVAELDGVTADMVSTSRLLETQVGATEESKVADAPTPTCHK